MKLTKKDVLDHINQLGLRSCEIHNASMVEAALSQVRGGLLMASMRLRDLEQDDLAPVMQSCFETLNGIIGDNFDVPVPPDWKPRKRQ